MTAANHIHTCCFLFSFHSPYTTIYNRFIAGQARTMVRNFEALATPGEDRFVLSLDSTSIKAHRCASGGKGGAQSSNRPLACRPYEETPYAERFLCRPVVLHLTAGQDADIAAAPDVLALAPPMSALLADKGYDGDKLRGEIIRRGAKPVIPNKSNRVAIQRFNKCAYKGRNVSNTAFAGSRTPGASPRGATSSAGISWPLRLLPLSSHIGSIEFGS
ncbi:transposase [Bradyrhizobium sp. CAR08]